MHPQIRILFWIQLNSKLLEPPNLILAGGRLASTLIPCLVLHNCHIEFRLGNMFASADLTTIINKALDLVNFHSLLIIIFSWNYIE